MNGSHITIHADLVQGSDEWLAARCGLLTASEMNLILTPTLKIASNEKERSHLYELLAQRITKYVEPHYVSFDMLRGIEDEVEALRIYSERHSPIERVGFITNDQWGFTIGYSPDAIVSEDGLVEAKSRRQKYQVETFVVDVYDGTVPAEFMLQVQTGLLVTERAWCDVVSYSGGLPMAVIRAYPDDNVQSAILHAAAGFEERLHLARLKYEEAVLSSKAVPTERKIQDIVV
jgi:hypothetical protein